MNLTEFTRETLRGLPGVMVVIEDVKEDAQSSGLDATDLQTDAERGLSSAGIRVLEVEEWRETPGRPWLYVSVNTLRHLGGYFFAIDVQLRQEVTLPGRPALITSAPTWELGSIGFVMADNLASQMRQSVQTHLQNFIEDCRAVNV